MYLVLKETVIRTIVSCHGSKHCHTHTQVPHLAVSHTFEPVKCPITLHCRHTLAGAPDSHPTSVTQTKQQKHPQTHTHTHVHVLENIANTGALSYAPTHSDSQTRTDTDRSDLQQNANAPWTHDTCRHLQLHSDVHT